MNLTKLIAEAKDADACETEIKNIEQLSSFEEGLKHPKAPYWCYWYAVNVIKERWHEVEDVINKDPEYAYHYARDMIKGRWYEAEDVINKDPEWAYYYAHDVIKGRWHEAENVINKDPEWAYYYAHDVIGEKESNIPHC